MKQEVAGAASDDGRGPQLLYVEDLALIFRIGLAGARKGIRLGQFGPYLKVGRRLVVLRTSLDDFLRESQVGVE
jgi:hypothetical protein